MDELISRQAAIDALDGLCDRECEYSKKQRYVMCDACHLGSAFDVIEKLPPSRENLVNNSNHIVNYLANDTISRQAAIDAVLNLNVENRVSWRDAVIDTIDAVPSAQPEIVRCEECINHGKEICYFWSRFYGTINTPDDGGLS